MTTATLSEVSAAVTKAFNAGSVGEEYKGIMPAAYDAGTAWSGEVLLGVRQDSGKQDYLTSLLKTAEVGYVEGKEGKPMRGPDYQGETVIMQTAVLWQANRAVYVQAYETGAAGSAAADTGKPNWTPWLIGAGVLAAVGIGAVVMTRKENPAQRPFAEIKTSDVGKRWFRAFGKRWDTQEFIGRIFPEDVGKRVYLVGDIVQVENDAQRSMRLRNVNPSKGKGARQQHEQGAEIVDNMAKSVWAEFWASREEEKGVSFSGVDIFYAAPEPPSGAKKWALDMAKELAEMNGLDPRKPYEAMEELYARAVAANEAAGQDSEPAHRFGSDLGMMITGSGASWFDDNAKFDLKKPYSEFYI